MRECFWIFNCLCFLIYFICSIVNGFKQYSTCEMATLYEVNYSKRANIEYGEMNKRHHIDWIAVYKCKNQTNWCDIRIDRHTQRHMATHDSIPITEYSFWHNVSHRIIIKGQKLSSMWEWDLQLMCGTLWPLLDVLFAL